MAQKIFVGGLSFQTSEQGLSEFFSQVGSVLSASVVTDRDTGRSRGFGFVEMASDADAERAVNQLNGRDLDGRQLKVELARPKPAHGRNDRYERSRGGWR